MRRACLILAAIGSLTLLCGCGPDQFVGDRRQWSAAIYGDWIIRGDSNRVTFRRDSRIWKLCVIGDENEIYFEDGALVHGIVFYGIGNRVSLPVDRHPTVTPPPENVVTNRPAPTSQP